MADVVTIIGTQDIVFGGVDRLYFLQIFYKIMNTQNSIVVPTGIIVDSFIDNESNKVLTLNGVGFI